MGIICIRDKNKTAGPFRNYKVSDLLDKIDCALTRYGFVKLEDNTDEEAKIRSLIYEGLKGKVVVRSATDDSGFIHYFCNWEEKAICPVYVELSQVPDLVEKSILNDLYGI